MAVTGVPLSKADVRAALAPGGAAGVCAETRRAAAAAAALCGPGVAVVRAFFDAVGGLPLLTCGKRPSNRVSKQDPGWQVQVGSQELEGFRRILASICR